MEREKKSNSSGQEKSIDNDRTNEVGAVSEIQSDTQQDGSESRVNKGRTKETIIEEIEFLIRSQIQPAVAMHGGVVTLHSYEEGIVTMFMSGSCSGCASSTLTLKNGIEGMLKHYIPEVIRVEGVDDENSEVAPYYSY